MANKSICYDLFCIYTTRLYVYTYIYTVVYLFVHVYYIYIHLHLYDFICIFPINYIVTSYLSLFISIIYIYMYSIHAIFTWQTILHTIQYNIYIYICMIKYVLCVYIYLYICIYHYISHIRSGRSKGWI
jgi:hypothetical protein